MPPSQRLNKRSTQHDTDRTLAAKLVDDGRFIRQWLDNPLSIGAIAPSGPELAAAMARAVEPNIAGPIVELGPGTGVVTQALGARGIDLDRLVLIEACDRFAHLLRKRFPKARVVQGDAFALRSHLTQETLPLAAVVSSLPLLTRPYDERRSLLLDALDHLAPGGGFIQFSYGLGPPVRPESGLFSVTRSGWIVRNMPPARVWVYRKCLT